MEKSVNNKVYMTFLTKNNISLATRLAALREKGIKAPPTNLMDYLYSKVYTPYIVKKLLPDENDESYKDIQYIITSDLKERKQCMRSDVFYFKDALMFYGIRPVIKTDGLISDLIKQNGTIINNDEVVLGSYPTQVITDMNLINTLKNIDYNGKVYNIPIDDRVVECQTITFANEDYVYIKDKNVFVKVMPLTWYYDKDFNSLICKDIIAGFYTKAMPGTIQNIGFNFMNQYLIKDVLKQNIIRLKEPVNAINDCYNDKLQKISLPYDSDIDMDNDGKIYSHEEKELNIVIDEKINKLYSDLLKYTFKNSYKDEIALNITIIGDNKNILTKPFDLKDIGLNTKIKSLTIKSRDTFMDMIIFDVKVPIENINLNCNLNIFSKLFLTHLFGEFGAYNLLKGSNLTIYYTSEKELCTFLKDISKIISKVKKCYFDNEKIKFSYKNIDHYFGFLESDNYDLSKDTLFEQIGLADITLDGPEINKEKLEKIIGVNFDVIHTPDDEFEEKISKVNEEPALSKEAEHILDLAKEIISIDYIGIDREDVRQKLDEIIDEYNKLYFKETKGLSLTTNNVLYTNTVIKLENLRDTLYHNFEKNIEYYDILDLIDNMIKKLNDEDTPLDYEILKDLDTLNNILKYSEDNQTKIEIIAYLEREKQNIIDYLCGKKETDYKTINEFIKKVRLFLMPILTRVSGNVSKIDVMEQIKNYALTEMNNKSSENTNNYIMVILTEIDKIKQSILEFDSNYAFEDINYSSFNTGNEIIKYLDNLFIKYYGIYLKLYDEMQKQDIYERNLIPKIY